MAISKIFDNNSGKKIGGGQNTWTNFNGSKSVSTGSWVDLTSEITVKSGTWLILSFIDLAQNSNSIVANKIICGSRQRATRGPGNSGGGLTNYMLVESDGTLKAKLQAYNYDASAKTFGYSLDFIRLE